MIRSFLGFVRVAGPAVVMAALVTACATQASNQADPGTSALPNSAPPSAAAVVAIPDASQEPVTGEPTDPARTPGPPVPRVPTLEAPAYASRVLVSDLEIDLPIISGDVQPPPSYPLCDVAAYVTRFSQPYETGVTYISAHAQKGMFAPLLKASEVDDGQALIGKKVDVYTNDGRRFTYSIDRVIRHALDYAVLATIDLAQQTLVLQTSEGPYGTLEKVQVVAALVEEGTVDVAEATPEAHPRDCRPPELGGPSPAP